jgi:cytochrome oxidase assembly protein ShyY1
LSGNQLKDAGYQGYENFHPSFSLTHVRVRGHFQTSKEKVVSGNQLKDAGYQGYEIFHPNFSLTRVRVTPT